MGKAILRNSQFSDETWQEKTTEAALKSDRDILLAYNDDEAIGLIFVFVRENSRIGGLAGFWVNPDHRRKGVGKTLVNAAMDWLKSQEIKEVNFWNNPENKASSAFYERMGFKYTGEEMTLESDPSKQVLLMNKNLG